jgi:hypothetical protein
MEKNAAGTTNFVNQIIQSKIANQKISIIFARNLISI